MKKIALFFVLAAAMTVFFSFKGEEEKYPTIAIGSEMPEATYAMKDISGESFSLEDLKEENGLLVVFSCNTCPFVIMWEDRYDDMKAYCSRMNIGMAMVNSNEAKRDGDDAYDAMVAHAEENNYTWPYLVDEQSKLANAFGAKTTPHVFLFDGEGKLVYEGAIDDNYKDIKAVTQRYVFDAMEHIYTGTEVELQTTRAVGCSIKRVL